MARLTKGEQKRLIKSILSKAQKLYIQGSGHLGNNIVNTKDMNAIEKMCKSFMKRLG